MRVFQTAVALLMMSMLPSIAHAQNAGAKGLDAEGQARFDREHDISRLESEIRTLLANKTLPTAVVRYAERATHNGMPPRTGRDTLERMLKLGFLEEARSFHYVVVGEPGGPTDCGRNSDGSLRGASTSGTRASTVCFDPLQLARDYYYENTFRKAVTVADRLLAACVHELAHNLGEEEGQALRSLTYLAEQTAAMGWEIGGVTSGMRVNLTVTPKIYLQVTDDSETCFKGLEVNGALVPRGETGQIPLPIRWDAGSEHWVSTSAGVLGLPSTDLEYIMVFVTESTTAPCRVSFKFLEDDGHSFYSFDHSVTAINEKTPDQGFELTFTQ